MGGVEAERIRGWIEDLGWWAPLGYIVFYMVGTILLLPSTPLNVSGGLIFGVAQGLFWTSFAAVLAAMVSFFYARFLGHSWARQRFGGYLKKMDAEVKRGGLWYIFALRLLPLIPYGIVNYGAGLTSISSRDYFVGTVLGTTFGVFPFVLMGAGIARGSLLPFTVSLSLIGILVFAATWYRRRTKEGNWGNGC
ncbi:MAG TPA: TVP38/TMEM64 family protein [Geminocystis sp. M7585_C2015_104]|nr:TVP38/TMEM64 family protein [Geminocystis sp. M7585_C2015_104]